MLHQICKRENKNQMILSRDAEEAFDKIRHPWQIQTLQSTGIEGTSLSIFKSIYEKPVAFSLSSTMWKHWEPFFEHQERETGMSTLTTSSQHTTRHLGLSNQATEKIKGIHIGKEVVKLALFTDGMHGTVPGKPKRLHPKIVELIQQIRQRGRILNLCQEISHLSIRQR